MRKVIFDCDIGTDDAIALTAAILAEHLEVIAITTVHGNASVAHCTDNALRLTEFLGADIPVYSGCPAPMTRNLLGDNCAVRMKNREPMLDDSGRPITIHEATIASLPPTTRKGETEHACSFIVNALRRAEEKITLVGVGPLTNIGMALRMAPDIADNIEEIYIMGGNLTYGNITPVGEANFYHDPEAAQIVLRSGVKNIICPLEVSTMGPIRKRDRAKLIAANAKIGGFLDQLLAAFVVRMKKLGYYDEHTEPGMCDWGAVAPLVEPGVIRSVRREIVDVEVARGFADGAMIIDRRPYALPEEDSGQNYVLCELDGDLMNETLIKLLKNA